MNRNNITLLISFILLVFFQTLVFNNLYLFGFVNPMIYILFLVIYRFDYDQTFFIFSSFILGFLIDFLSLSGGAHTISTLTIGFLRPSIIKYTFSVSSEMPVSFQDDNRIFDKYLFLSTIVGLHHFLYFILVYFNLEAISLIIKNTLLTFIFSLILVSLISIFYSKSNDS
tara:strand:- start:2272 stop:2781 length:510 start_codon:yes stop_codon:yes gene_type:complete